MNKKIYFASDTHFGLPTYSASREREKLFVSWLDSVKNDAEEIYLLGDIFDFWFEYKKVIPRGFSRLIGKLSELSDAGIVIHLFKGNHDMWIFDYLPEETGIKLHSGIVVEQIKGKKFLFAHGDGLGFSSFGFKILKSLFSNPALQWMFARLHPNFALTIGHFWSNRSRFSKDIALPFKGEETEELILFAKEKLKQESFDYFVFGHRHIPMDIRLNETCRLINLGDWLIHFTYAEFDGKEMTLRSISSRGLEDAVIKI
jgi:UDP-2,3-diacylglucosamine hydrolase